MVPVFLWFRLHSFGCTLYWGNHAGAHRDWPAIEQVLQEHFLPDGLIAQLRRVFTVGCPAFVNASASELNFHQFLRHGNHKTVLEDIPKTKAAALKNVRREHALAADARTVFFTYDMHLTPLGLVDLDQPFKQPRPIFDSTFRPTAGSYAINDWTDAQNEPEIHFAVSLL